MPRTRPVLGTLARTTDRTGACQHCNRPVLWARTWHLDDTSHRPKWIPLDPDQADATDHGANIAISRDRHGSLLARVLRSGEAPICDEARGRVHMATCPGRQGQLALDTTTVDQLPPNVIPLRRPARRR
jgi:hypothetical protein